MDYRHILILSFFIWGFICNTGCSSQTKEKAQPYPACEPRSNTDPGRLNIRAGAEDFGMTTPCSVNFELYINSNSRIRSLVLDLAYLNTEGETVQIDQIRANLEHSSSGIFQKVIPAPPVPGETCRSLHMVIRSIACYAADESIMECPDIRVIPPDAAGSLRVDDSSVTVCSGGS